MADGILTPCNVARGSGITTVNSSSGSILQCNKWVWDDMPFHCIRPNVRHIGILLLVSISTISPQSTCHSASVCELLSKSDHQSGKNNVMSIFKMTDLSHLEIYGSNNGFFGKPMYDFLYVVNRYHCSKLLSFFEKIVFFVFWRQSDRQTD